MFRFIILTISISITVAFFIWYLSIVGPMIDAASKEYSKYLIERQVQ